MANRDVDWDNIIELGYAAEQLFMATQLLTSDTVPREHAVRETCNRYLARLMGHSELLPAEIIGHIRECQRHCEGLRSRGSIFDQDVHELSASIISLFGEIRLVLKDIQQESGRGERAA